MEPQKSVVDIRKPASTELTVPTNRSAPMKRYLVRNPDHGTGWEDARDFVEADPHDAAEMFAQRECASDSESYRTYESGVLVEVKEWNTGRITFVSVHVSFKPTFHSTIQRSADQPSEQP